jgi:hypothetical protein
MIVFRTTKPNPYKPNVYYQVSISTEDIIIYSMTTNDVLFLDVSFIIRFKVTNSFDKEEKISHPRPTQ